MDEGQILALRLATLGCATLVLIASAVVAMSAMKSRGSWWTTLGGFAISGAMILAGYAMFSNAAYMWSHL